MDLSGNRADEAFRAEIRQFIAESLPADLKSKVERGVRLHAGDSQRWHQILAKKG
jgi:hypothetical protein